MANYYDNNKEEFIASTVKVDIQHLYLPFLEQIPVGGRVLDAGCGSGRDSLLFMQRGYEVVAFDASSEMVAAASEYTGQTVFHYRFDTIPWKGEFDGVWACASVLHVEKKQIDDTLHRLVGALKPDGIIYLSFKYGEGEEDRDGRHFSNYTENSFLDVIANNSETKLIRMWKTKDSRPGRDNEFWLNVLLKKQQGG